MTKLIFAVLLFLSLNAEVLAAWTPLKPTPNSSCKTNLPANALTLQGDFRGIHQIETAVIETNAKLKQSHLVVKFKDRPGEGEVVKTWDGIKPDVYLALASAHAQKSWCGKNKTCTDDDTHSVKLNSDGIVLGNCVAAEEALFYWDPAGKEFKEAVIAD